MVLNGRLPISLNWASCQSIFYWVGSTQACRRTRPWPGMRSSWGWRRLERVQSKCTERNWSGRAGAKCSNLGTGFWWRRRWGRGQLKLKFTKDTQIYLIPVDYVYKWLCLCLGWVICGCFIWKKIQCLWPKNLSLVLGCWTRGHLSLLQRQPAGLQATKLTNNSSPIIPNHNIWIVHTLYKWPRYAYANNGAAGRKEEGKGRKGSGGWECKGQVFFSCTSSSWFLMASM